MKVNFHEEQFQKYMDSGKYGSYEVVGWNYYDRGLVKKRGDFFCFSRKNPLDTNLYVTGMLPEPCGFHVSSIVVTSEISDAVFSLTIGSKIFANFPFSYGARQTVDLFIPPMLNFSASIERDYHWFSFPKRALVTLEGRLFRPVC